MNVNQLREQGNDFFKSEKYKEAYNSYMKAIDMCDKNNKPLISQLLTNLSATALILERVSESIHLSTQAIDLDPTNFKAYIRRGNSLCESMDWQGAYNDFETAIRINPSAVYFKQRMDFAKQQIVNPHIPDESIPLSFEISQTITQKEQTNEPVLDAVRKMMQGIRPNKDYLKGLIRKVYQLQHSLPNIVFINCSSTIKIVGDIHGQFQDLIQIFERYGYPSKSNPYLFNGDFVDRGSMGVEVVSALLMFKALDMESIYMNRGNQYVFHSTLECFEY